MGRQGGKTDQDKPASYRGEKKKRNMIQIIVCYQLRKIIFSYQIHVSESQSSILCCLSSPIIRQVCSQKGCSFIQLFKLHIKTDDHLMISEKNAPSNAVAHARNRTANGNVTRHWPEKAQLQLLLEFAQGKSVILLYQRH